MHDTENIRFECPQCEKRLRVPATATGKRVRCPKCTRLVTVPDQSEAGRELPEMVGGPARWPWLAGAAAAFLLLVGLGIWVVAGNKKQQEPSPPEQLAAGPTAPPKPSRPVEPAPKQENKVPSDNKPVKPRQPEVDKENALYFDKPQGIARFIPRITDKLDAGEELALFVLMAPPNGRTLDDEMAASHFRGDIAFRFSPLTGGSFSSGRAFSGGQVLGDMNVFYRIQDGKQIRFDLSERAAAGKVSAAVGVKKTIQGNFRFVRFVTPVSTLPMPSG
jgi:hypothetical protein